MLAKNTTRAVLDSMESCGQRSDDLGYNRFIFTAHTNSLSTISVIATVLNEVESIDPLVRSLLLQSLQPTDIVIVDGGSTDGTWEKLQEHARASGLLRVIRDESCNLKNCRGPIARGRNVAIAAARAEVIACCDAGCSYGPEWLARLTAPITNAGAEYVLGGSCIATDEATVWDIAAAPLMGIATKSEGTRKSCTARSMAFTRLLWERAGKFPEDTLLGEDTVFDERAQRLTRPAYAEGAMAVYAPQFTYALAIKTLARYSSADGALKLRRARLVRMLLRCFAQATAIALLWWKLWPLVIVAALEFYFAIERDASVLRPKHWRALLPRILFSLSVPWVTVVHYIRGRYTKANLPNQQNAAR
jgi:glycosyltransferase involved in cell wall biosynthesis